jgi:hypothetical protein
LLAALMVLSTTLCVELSPLAALLSWHTALLAALPLQLVPKISNAAAFAPNPQNSEQTIKVNIAKYFVFKIIKVYPIRN